MCKAEAPTPAPTPAEAPYVSWALQTSETSLRNFYYIEVVEMACRVVSRTNGKFKIRILLDKEIGIDCDKFPAALAHGTIDMAWLYTTVMEGLHSFLGVFGLLKLVQDLVTTTEMTLYLKQYDRISAGGWVWQID